MQKKKMAFRQAIGNLKKTLHVACIDTKWCIIQIIALEFLIFIHTWHGLRVINYQFAGKSKVESSNLKQTTKDLNFIVTKDQITTATANWDDYHKLFKKSSTVISRNCFKTCVKERDGFSPRHRESPTFLV